MTYVWIIFKREIKAYFNTPLAYVLLAIFSLLSIGLTFWLQDFLDQGDCSLESFFDLHPWVFMIIGPAIGMRLWSEEHRTGTTELLLTMPISPWQAILGKYLAACLVVLAALAATVSMVITLSWLGDPDWGKVFSGYVGSFLVGAASIAITCAVSAFTRSQITCLLISVSICFFLVLAGNPMVAEALSSVWSVLGSVGQAISFGYHSRSMAAGNMTLQGLTYMVGLIAYCLFLTSVVIRRRRS